MPELRVTEDAIGALNVGDVIKSIAGQGVTWPYDQLSYRVTSVSGDRIGLEIIGPQAKSLKAPPPA